MHLKRIIIISRSIHTPRSTSLFIFFLLESVYEVRPLISEELDLTLVQAFGPVITVTTHTLAVFATKQEVLQDRAAAEKQDEVSKHNAMTGVESRCILITIDIG